MGTSNPPTERKKAMAATSLGTCQYHYEAGGKCNDIGRTTDVDLGPVCERHAAVRAQYRESLPPVRPRTRIEYGIRRTRGDVGSVAGPLPLVEVRDLAPKWGGEVVSRVVTIGPWESAADREARDAPDTTP